MDVNNIFSVTPAEFLPLSLEMAGFQYLHNPVYRKWCDLTGVNPADVKTLKAIPALPIGLFKTAAVTTTLFKPDYVFESSGTTQTINSRHLVKDLDLYRQSFQTAFRQFYGQEKDWCILGLLPAYLERQHSSLVMMVDELIKAGGHAKSGFYLHDMERLAETLISLEAAGQKTILIGVTFGLLDFAEAYPMPLKHTIIMETGGMKGRRKELTRSEVHAILSRAFDMEKIHSEYGMTELLSQAYSAGDGRFYCPPWMKVMVRDEEDPSLVREEGRGLLQVIDLANIYSAAFIATEDVGRVYPDGSFEVWGRQDNADIRGCSLLVV
jgi:hypothetical protein